MAFRWFPSAKQKFVHFEKVGPASYFLHGGLPHAIDGVYRREGEERRTKENIYERAQRRRDRGITDEFIAYENQKHLEQVTRRGGGYVRQFTGGKGKGKLVPGKGKGTYQENSDGMQAGLEKSRWQGTSNQQGWWTRVDWAADWQAWKSGVACTEVLTVMQPDDGGECSWNYNTNVCWVPGSTQQ